jgi:hypothetical protein
VKGEDRSNQVYYFFSAQVTQTVLSTSLVLSLSKTLPSLPIMTTQSGAGSVTPPTSAASQNVNASDTRSLAKYENLRPNINLLEDSL